MGALDFIFPFIDSEKTSVATYSAEDFFFRKRFGRFRSVESTKLHCSPSHIRSAGDDFGIDHLKNRSTDDFDKNYTTWRLGFRQRQKSVLTFFVATKNVRTHLRIIWYTFSTGGVWGGRDRRECKRFSGIAVIESNTTRCRFSSRFLQKMGWIRWIYLAIFRLVFWNVEGKPRHGCMLAW